MPPTTIHVNKLRFKTSQSVVSEMMRTVNPFSSPAAPTSSQVLSELGDRVLRNISFTALPGELTYVLSDNNDERRYFCRLMHSFLLSCASLTIHWCSHVPCRHVIVRLSYHANMFCSVNICVYVTFIFFTYVNASSCLHLRTVVELVAQCSTQRGVFGGEVFMTEQRRAPTPCSEPDTGSYTHSKACRSQPFTYIHDNRSTAYVSEVSRPSV